MNNESKQWTTGDINTFPNPILNLIRQISMFDKSIFLGSFLLFSFMLINWNVPTEYQRCKIYHIDTPFIMLESNLLILAELSPASEQFEA
jgi:hypothetical protein